MTNPPDPAAVLQRNYKKAHDADPRCNFCTDNYAVAKQSCIEVARQEREDCLRDLQDNAAFDKNDDCSLQMVQLFERWRARVEELK